MVKVAALEAKDFTIVEHPSTTICIVKTTRNVAAVETAAVGATEEAEEN
jgi:hypothetical protein